MTYPLVEAVKDPKVDNNAASESFCQVKFWEVKSTGETQKGGGDDSASLATDSGSGPGLYGTPLEVGTLVRWKVFMIQMAIAVRAKLSAFWRAPLVL